MVTSHRLKPDNSEAHQPLQATMSCRGLVCDAVHRPLTKYGNGSLPEISSLALAASLACALPVAQGQGHHPLPLAPLQASRAQAQLTLWSRACQVTWS